jgi:hypothetical protein
MRFVCATERAMRARVQPIAILSPRPRQEVVVRTPSPDPTRFARALLFASLIAAAGCGGGGSSSNIPNGGSFAICDSNSAGLALARPTPGFSANGNQIEIVDNGNGDQLAQFTSQYDLNLVDNFGNEVDTGFLTAVPDPSGPHPYGSDFFYAGTLNSGLQSGRTYTVYLNAPNTNCSRGVVGSFST